MYKSIKDNLQGVQASFGFSTDQTYLLHRISAKGGYNVGERTLATKRAGFVFSESVTEE